jgi:hypothetical protein
MEEYLEEYGSGLLMLLFAGAAMSGNAGVARSLFARLDLDKEGQLQLMSFKQDVSAGGLVEVAKMIGTSPRDWAFRDFVPALARGHLAFVQWILSQSVLRRGDRAFAVAYAAESGSMDLVRWLVDEKGCRITNDAALAAARAGQLDFLRWVHGQVGGNLQPAVKVAARNGLVHVLEWLIEQGCEVTEETVYEAARAPTTATLAFLLDRRYPYDEETLVLSSCKTSRTSEVLKFLIATKQMQCDPAACREASAFLLVDVDTVLHQVLGTPLGDDSLARCAHSGDIARVRYALAHGAPLQPSALSAMMVGEECAMLSETIGHYSENGTLTDELRGLLDEALHMAERESRYLSEGIVQVLARFKFQVPEERMRVARQ